MRKAILTLAAVMALAGCGEAKKAFDENFDKSFSESCVASATRSGAPASAAKSLCDCALIKVNAQFTAAEKAGAANSEKIKPILEECVKSVESNNG